MARVVARQSSAVWNLYGFVREIGQLLVKEEVDKGDAIVEFSVGESPTFWDVMPVFEARTAASRGCMLGIVDSITLKRRLTTVTRRLGDCEVLAQPIACGVLQLVSTLTLSMAHRSVIDWAMKEVMADHFVLKRLEGVDSVAPVSAMQPLPVDEVRTAGTALAPLIWGHLLQLLEAVQFIVAIGRRALDLKRERLLKFGHSDPQFSARSSSCRSSSLSIS